MSESECLKQIEVDRDGKVPIPEKYREQQFVLRSKDATQVYHKSSTIFYAGDNDLEPGIVQIKPFGGDPELFEIVDCDGDRFLPDNDRQEAEQ